MIDPHSLFLLISTLVAVIGLILLVAVFKLNPFLSLLVASLGLGIVAGMPPATIIKSFETGLGGTLGHIAIIVALGTMLGKMMAESGAADRIAHTLIDWFGEKRVPLAMMVSGLVVGLPAFFEVGFVLLVPIAFTVARRTRTNLILVCVPMVAGLSVVHGLVPPHPAALLAAMIYKADVGRTIFYGLLVGVPTAFLAGPVFAKLVAPHVDVPAEVPMAADFVGDTQRRKTEAELDAQATLVREIRKICHDSDVVANLHNHTYEVANGMHDLKGTLARIPDMKLGPDLNWLIRGGVDPVNFIKTYGSQIVYMHIRDQYADGTWTEYVGQGSTNFAAIADALRSVNFRGRAAIELAFEKNYLPKNPLAEDWKRSVDFVRTTFGW